MNKFFLILINTVLLIYSILTLFPFKVGFWSTSFSIAIVLGAFNIIMLITYLVERRISKKLQKKKEKNYSLFDWLGDSTIYSSLYQNLKGDKGVYNNNFNDNYDKVLRVIRNEFPTRDDLIKLKTNLEVIQMSPRFKLLKSAVIPSILAILTPALVQITNIFLNETKMSEVILISSATLFTISFLSLMFFIDCISKISDRNSFLLKVVEKFLENDSYYKYK